PDGMPGATLSVSSNGSTAGTGILWAALPYVGDANLNTVPGVLRAFDASNANIELWNSLQAPTRDGFGNFGKFAFPTGVNGKVYLATVSNQLVVYGPNPPPPPPPSGISFVQVSAATPQASTASVVVNYPGAQTAGDLNVVVVGWNDGVANVQSVTD